MATTEQDGPFSEGYAAYQRGQKMPADHNTYFRAGWYAAQDAGEMFGPFETPNQAPEQPYRWSGEDAPTNDREEAIYQRGWNDALKWAFPGGTHE